MLSLDRKVEGEVAMILRTTPEQRAEFWERHQQGESYQDIADTTRWSKECIRAWCRRQRDGQNTQTTYRRVKPGLLSRFHPLVRYVVLRLRLGHPHWGPGRIRAQLPKRLSLHHRTLPSPASIGRYLHQWTRFRHRPRPHPAVHLRPSQPTHVHQRWQMDFKMGIPLNNGALVNLYTVRDPVGEVCLGAFVFPAGQVGSPPRPMQLDAVRSVLRQCFTRWETRPEEVQTDGEPILIGQQSDVFPSVFTLWLLGLGITHLRIRPGKPTDNAEVERCHRTVTDYAIVGNEDSVIEPLQAILDRAVDELAFELPSRAEGCRGKPPVVAHPEIVRPPRPFRPEQELAVFDLARVDAYLARLTLQRKIDQAGHVSIGGRHRYYGVGRAYAGHTVNVRFDPSDRHFAFCQVEQPETEIKRCPSRGLDLAALTGLEVWPLGLGVQQLPLPFPMATGVYC